jgi:hypothetical protein
MATSRGVDAWSKSAKEVEFVSVLNPKTKATLRAIATIAIKKFLTLFPVVVSGLGVELIWVSVVIGNLLKLIKHFHFLV